MPDDTKEMAEMLTRWKARILDAAHNRVDRLFFNSPVEDLTERQQGFEEGLTAAMKAIRSTSNHTSTKNEESNRKI